MNALVVGYGSIGSRHARLLSELGCSVAVVSRRDVSFPTRYATLLEALEAEHPDYVVVANRTSEHMGTLEILAQTEFDGTLLIEKPLCGQPVTLPDGLPKKTYVAYNLRFHPLIEDLHKRLENEVVLSVQVYAGQYLPDWRPKGNYRESYSAHHDQGGGVLRDLSHELDYLNWMLGGWRRMTACGGRFSQLDIDSDDVFVLLLEMSRCPAVTVHLNYLDRVPHRALHLNTNDHTFRVDLIKGTLSVDGDVVSECKVPRDATYRAEHEAVLGEARDALCTLEEGMEVVRLMNAAEKAATNQNWISKRE